MKMSRRLVALTVTGLLVLLSGLWASPAYAAHTDHERHSFPDRLYAPYQDVSLGPSLQSVMQSTGQKYFTLAFVVSGGGCNAAWGSAVLAPFNQTAKRLPHLTSDIEAIRHHGGDVIASFGGAAGSELALTCSDANSLQQQYQRVIDTYQVTHFDFDIEGGTQNDVASYTRRNTALAALQKANPHIAICNHEPA